MKKKHELALQEAVTQIQVEDQQGTLEGSSFLRSCISDLKGQ